MEGDSCNACVVVIRWDFTVAVKGGNIDIRYYYVNLFDIRIVSICLSDR